MKNLMRSLAFVLMVGGAYAQSNLPACQGSDTSKWNRCSGIKSYQSGIKYEGEFQAGNFHGRGVYTFTNGDRYVGEFVQRQRV